ncbi:hybrid sensor histidine kinase/response regulator [Rhodobaculum claviforme]|uniref:histidine kinase n=1 Tax=Rhodobaculum claviforme TaxID=1549854 RepID=A0A934WHR8_9RHOB|nr:PAS domain-containing sensor histidine kinase [Rhodobaculum claviforme]MBK5926086.1 hybrid sensor histidine kinase/response regulator [Rhodobaculum claviforme]
MAPGTVRMAVVSVSVTLACLAAMVSVLAWREGRGATARIVPAPPMADDTSPMFTADCEGRILSRNPAADSRFGTGATLVAALGGLVTGPGALLYRLQARATADGSASEEVAALHGPLRLSVHRSGAGVWLWRLEDHTADASGAARLPMLRVSKSGTVLCMNAAMQRLVGVEARTLDRIFPHLPLRSGEVTEVAGAAGPCRRMVAEVDAGEGRREVYLLPAPDAARPTAARAEFEDLPLALARVSPDGQVIKANRVARDLLGLVMPALGQPPRLAELLEGPGRPVGDWLADAMSGLAENRPQVLRLRRSDPDSYLQVTLRRVAEDGRPGLLAVFNDATELKSLEAQIVQSQKMQAIGQLAGGVAHDFNNLLTAISGHCDLLMLRHDRGDPDYADLVQIHQNANRAAALVRQLLAFSRKQTLRPEVFDLRDTLGELTHLLSRLVGERVALVLDHDSDLDMVRADRRQIEQVIMNLVVNGRDAMREGGEIRIETRNRTLGESLVRDRALVPPGAYVVVRVSDQGAGIPPEHMTKIFEPFFTTKRAGEGTGLGLSTAYGIVKQTGGFIFVDSTPGTGTVFSLYLPACAPVPEPEAASDPAVPTPEPGRDCEGVILLVEDEAPVRAFAARALRMRGHTVIEASSAEEALGKLDDPGLHVDLFLTDVIMPGLDGPTWVRKALGQRPQARVVFMSGYAEEALETGRTAIPNAVFLPKPFSLSELTATVQAQLQ